jgi:CHAT domain-containing protein
VLAAVSNPTGDLRFADDEAARIAALFADRGGAPDAVQVLSGNAATPASVLGMVGRGNYIHFACHADFQWADPVESGLLLAGEQRLRIADILSPAMDLSRSRLITLSACETGMTEFRTMPDEFVGLVGALLEAGAPAVVSSLWPVDDMSTTLLLTEMYRLHLDGLGVAAALQRAQHWLRHATAGSLVLADVYRRVHAASGGTDSGALEGWQYFEQNPDVRPFEHPFYWAAFTVTGAA